MALTPSSMMALGTQAPTFELIEPKTNQVHSLEHLRGDQGTLVMFICNHCPYVVHILDGLVTLGHDYASSPINIIAISANDPNNYPADAPDKMAKLATQQGFEFPYLFDESQAIAKAYGAECTPDFFLFDQALKCVYRGQFDDSRPGNDIAVTGADLRAAMNALIEGNTIGSNQKPSIGCNIKWR